MGSGSQLGIHEGAHISVNYVEVKMIFGPGLEPRAAVTAWDPPRMFAAQGESWDGAPPIATEWSVEARDGGGPPAAFHRVATPPRTLALQPDV